MPLTISPGSPWAVRDRTGVVMGTLDLVRLANRLWEAGGGRARLVPPFRVQGVTGTVVDSRGVAPSPETIAELLNELEVTTHGR